MSDVFLGIDIGTGSTKGILADAEGNVLAAAVRHHSMSLPRPGWAEMDAEKIWWADVVDICRELAPSIEPNRLAGMCASGLGPCLLLCGPDLAPVRPAILYGIDMRATAEINELTKQLGEDALLQRCGKLLSTQAVGPKMCWVRKHEQEAWQAATRWYNSSSYIAARLTGAYVLDHHTASQCDPLYDLRERTWAQDWAAPIVEHLQMPELVWPHEVIGTLTPAAAAATLLPVGTPVSAGTVDAWSEAFSAGVRHPGDLMLMYGSTMFFVQVLNTLTARPLLWTTCGVEPDQYTLAAGMATSGSLTSWIKDLTGAASFDDLVSDAAAAPVGSNGLIMLPYFAGERTPIYDDKARGVIAGLTLRHTRGDLFRAAYEGIAFGIRQIIEYLDNEESPIQRLVAVGGGTQGGLWTQIVSDVVRRPQIVPSQTVGASYGDALLAAIGVGRVAADTEWATNATVVQPNPAHGALYDRLYESYEDLYPATKPVVHTLADLQHSDPLVTSP